MESIEISRECHGCKEVKFINDFHKSRENAGGRSNFCKYCRSIYRKNYYSKNKEREGANAVHWQNKNKGAQVRYRKNRKERRPWINSFNDARARCNNPNNSMYRWYGEKGIKFLMTEEDFKFLWFRDGAYLMRRPSIDRINEKGNYSMDNCQFIELVYNIKKRNGKKDRYEHGIVIENSTPRIWKQIIFKK